jgi:hypothetical protein
LIASSVTATLGPGAQCDEGRGLGSLAPVVAGEWHHRAFTYSRQPGGGARIGIFIDGVVENAGVTEQVIEQAKPCIDPTTLHLCARMNPAYTMGYTFRGAIDELRISDVVRYRDSFTPERQAADEHTVALLHFDALPLVDDGPHHVAVDATGAVALLPAAHP